MKVLYCGDSAPGGAANYLLSVMAYNLYQVTHVPPGTRLTLAQAEKKYDLIVLSDYSKSDLSGAPEAALCDQVRAGAGLLMIGGWGSFSGPFGGWEKSKIAELLPVTCSTQDDRKNISSGLLIRQKKNHKILKGLNFKDSPVICGFNDVKPKKHSETLLTLREVDPKKLKLKKKEYPLLVLGSEGFMSAAFTTDFAPHWCGGLVDWGSKRCSLSAGKYVAVEVGHLYVRWITQLFEFLGQNRMSRSPRVRVNASGIHNKGVFAVQAIKKGERILRYDGIRYTEKQVDRLKDCDYIFQLSKKTYVDGKNSARYVNHSCEPNCEVDVVKGEIWISAIKSIKKGEELTYNYGYDLEECKHYKCLCGVKDCVGWILAEEHWPELEKQQKKAKKGR